MTAESLLEVALGCLRQGGFEGPYTSAIVTGTGLGGLASCLEQRIGIAYADIPGFPRLGVSGHAGSLFRGRLADRPVLVFEGRIHAYEAGDAAAMRLPLTIAKRLGAETLLLTNSSGSLMPEAGPGSLVALSDHINLSGFNPLIGEPSDARFVPMIDAYDPGLRALLRDAAAASGISLHEGIYAWFSGPNFETPAEVRMAGRLGADLVGMSTVPETILARFLGLRVAALSVVTNHAAGIAGGDPHHAETKAVAARAADDLARLVTVFLARLPLPSSAPGS
ncbi:purine-nucleoside phosphorylase [Methylobacterium sp. C25]|uniref:purine-nucleoside phosphorylase n=1 Tax=Methylobacterium sp. C25 TaxID=2721622 RepID=UPI001F19788C|nr:purine-nucleoside phosphorylase [Methylobacterium sp. C25]